MTTMRVRKTRPSNSANGSVLAIGCVALVVVAGVIGIGSLTTASGTPSPPSTLDAIVSSADGTQRIVDTTLEATPIQQSAPAQITVDPHQTRQYLNGVGAALTDASAHLLSQLSNTQRQDALRALFDPTKGGLSVVRLVIGSSDFSRQLNSLDDSSTPDPALTKFSIAHDLTEIIPIARQIFAINPRVTFIASSWSAPAWMKTTNNILYGTLKTEYENAYANYLVKFLTSYRAAGVDVARISVQNEPASINLTMPTMLMDTAQQTRIINLLATKLPAAGLGTRVLVWDHNWCTATPPGGCTGPAPPQPALDVLHATAGAYPVAGTALHCYGGDQVTADQGMHAAWPDLEIWQTECTGGDWNGTRTQAFTGEATLVVRDWANWASASLLWNLALDPSGGPHTGGCGDCRGVLTINPATGTWTPNLDLDVLATVARFGPAGSGGLATTLTGAPKGLEAASVCSPDRRAAVIVWNPGAATTVTVRFGDAGFAVPFGAGTLTSVRAPASVLCDVARPAPIASVPPTSPTTSTTSPTTSPATSVQSTSPVPSLSVSVGSDQSVAAPAVAVTTSPKYTG